MLFWKRNDSDKYSELNPVENVWQFIRGNWLSNRMDNSHDTFVNLCCETLFFSMAHARVEIATWVEDYNRERPHSALGYAPPAAFAAELNKQWPASTALMRNKAVRL
jgi:hypothetical protein